jgi:hypothetical protein
MKSRITKDEKERLLIQTYQKQLRMSMAQGMSYGSKVAAQVVSDMFDRNKPVEELTLEECVGLLNAIKHFIDTTLTSSLKGTQIIYEKNLAAYENVVDAANNLPDILSDESQENEPASIDEVITVDDKTITNSITNEIANLENNVERKIHNE